MSVHDDCIWYLDDLDDVIWITSCGNAFQFTEDGPAENQFRYCPYCGGCLVELEQQSD